VPPGAGPTPPSNIIETAKVNGLDPQEYLEDVLDRIHDHKVNRLDHLLQ
jgi:transposase